MHELPVIRVLFSSIYAHSVTYGRACVVIATQIADAYIFEYMDKIQTFDNVERIQLMATDLYVLPECNECVAILAAHDVNTAVWNAEALEKTSYVGGIGRPR